MSSLRSVGRSAAKLVKNRVSACRFTFADGRKCRTPRAGKHPNFCFEHARKESQARSAGKLARELAYFFSGEYVSANDLSAALGCILPAVLQGDVKPRTARTLAYLAQTLLQTIHLAQHEYINAFGTNDWRNRIREGVLQNFDHRNPPPPPNPPCSGRSSDRCVCPATHPCRDRASARLLRPTACLHRPTQPRGDPPMTTVRVYMDWRSID